MRASNAVGSFLGALSVSALAAQPRNRLPASPRATYTFNPGWKLSRSDLPDADAVNFDDIT
jgi:hypothetical protein